MKLQNFRIHLEPGPDGGHTLTFIQGGDRYVLELTAAQGRELAETLMSKPAKKDSGSD